MQKLTIICPCCETSITVDTLSGAILAHDEKKAPTASFEDLASQLAKQKQQRDQLFEQEFSSVKDRERILEEKFQEALKRAEGSEDKPFRNPLDMD